MVVVEVEIVPMVVAVVAAVVVVVAIGLGRVIHVLVVEVPYVVIMEVYGVTVVLDNFGRTGALGGQLVNARSAHRDQGEF